MSLSQDLRKLRGQAQQELREVSAPAQLEAWRIKYLGSKGALREAMRQLKDVPRQDKPAAGKAANEVKNALTAAFEERSKALESSTPAGVEAAVDASLPGQRPIIGHAHVLTQTINEICEIFTRMGFSVAYGPEVEDERHNFNALNIPPGHLARDRFDNFYINESAMLRSQTSTVQIRVMESQSPPVRIIAPGRVYRPDTVDATHSFMFHQLEGLYVDEVVSMGDLKSCVDQFSKAYFGSDVITRFRPSFFPFTEPSAEIDLEFFNDDGSPYWVEVGGCGMVHPNVLEAVEYDSEKYTGFAFGLGIERFVMRKYDIPDIRLLFENDIRFLHQF
ncbi:MAG: phenylalanine--tRNA ligase subunit alpha [Planctomycetes bacterium]|nr:phenylalanine--tRNA ligase subunit alpha [Planctomycetota bacterium]